MRVSLEAPAPPLPLAPSRPRRTRGGGGQQPAPFQLLPLASAAAEREVPGGQRQRPPPGQLRRPARGSRCPGGGTRRVSHGMTGTLRWSLPSYTTRLSGVPAAAGTPPVAVPRRGSGVAVPVPHPAVPGRGRALQLLVVADVPRVPRRLLHVLAGGFLVLLRGLGAPPAHRAMGTARPPRGTPAPCRGVPDPPVPAPVGGGRGLLPLGGAGAGHGGRLREQRGAGRGAVQRLGGLRREAGSVGAATAQVWLWGQVRPVGVAMGQVGWWAWSRGRCGQWAWPCDRWVGGRVRVGVSGWVWSVGVVDGRGSRRR